MPEPQSGSKARQGNWLDEVVFAAGPQALDPVIDPASAGLKTQPNDIMNVGCPAVALLVVETGFLAVLIGVALGIGDFTSAM